MRRKVFVEKSRVLGFATDWFRSNVRVILQYSVKYRLIASYIMPYITSLSLLCGGTCVKHLKIIFLRIQLQRALLGATKITDS